MTKQIAVGDKVRLKDTPNTAYHGIVATVREVRDHGYPYQVEISGAHSVWVSADEVEAVKDPVADALRNFVIFHSPTHPEHDKMHEEFAEDCIANECPMTVADMLDDLVSAAKRALGEQPA